LEDKKIMEILNSPAPKLLSPFTELEVTEALAYTTNALTELIDTVFFANNEHCFLTRERADDLKALKSTTQIMGEIAAIQLAGMAGGGAS
jgi:hypothetical protein